MGAKSKKLRSAKRKADKHNAKAQRKAQYEGYAKIGKERKRNGMTIAGGAHIACGNPACKKCFSELHARMALRA